MHAPAHICRAVARLNPGYRIGWMGEPPDEDENLNPGAFALVHLRSRDEVGDEENPLKTFKGNWDVIPVVNEYGQYMGVDRVSRGPLYNKCGGIRPDWDPMQVRPNIVQVFDAELGYNPQDICSGRFLIVVAMQAHKLAYKMRRDDAIRKGKAAESRMGDLAAGMTDFLWYEANKTHQAWQGSTRKDDREVYRKGRLKYHKEQNAYAQDDYFLNRLGYK